MQAYAYGFPRLGKNREYKRTIEGFWQGNVSETELQKSIENLQTDMLANYESKVDMFPVGEMTLYDNMLDTAIMFGMYPCNSLGEYYELCRGKQALEMTKWFNTNYHYLVPDFSGLRSPNFGLAWNKPLIYHEKYQKGIPYVIGPFTFLKLSKGIEPKNFYDTLSALTEYYDELMQTVDQIHIDEPAFVLELSQHEIEGIKKVYAKLGENACKVYLFTYYESVDFLPELYDFPVEAIGLDFVNSSENLLSIIESGFPAGKTLIAGLINGRNVWRTDIAKAVDILRILSGSVDEMMVSNAGPLFHLPLTTMGETFDDGLGTKLAFAQERLQELQLINNIYQGNDGSEAKQWVSPKKIGENRGVTERVKRLGEKDFVKSVPYEQRANLQKHRLKLPTLPTTTIGSFPQTSEIRKHRADFRTGRISEQNYQSFIRDKISELVKKQEEIGLDVLVHGEFERTDMVEFFATKLKGVATTKNGWIISYGTRGYRPPIIYGDISRPQPMTVEEVAYAQSLTSKPVKGMLTGPVTIIAWSFVREDIPISDVAYQIALCLQDEIKDYEKAGIGIIQIDEPAFREKAPIKRSHWDTYFDWAIKSFRLATNSKPETQIHSHMCYSEFGEIITQIAQMDFDVISIEATRSKGDVIASFERADFDRQIGLGVWDIHSPVIPSVEDIKKIIQRALYVIPKDRFWINPDCGLKTRKWEETLPSLRNMVVAAKELRLKL